MTKVKRTIFKRKSGKSVGKWVARITYLDDLGITRQVERLSSSKRSASDLCEQIATEIAKSHGGIRTGDKMTFNDLANYCEVHFYKPATYADGRKIEGVRSVTTAMAQLKVLREYFGKYPLRSIVNVSLREYRLHRLKTVSKHTGRKISVTTVNRELAMMRRMINIALNEGWIVKDPFRGNKSLINLADEKPRERILSKAEEERLLLACEINTRLHIKPLIVLALDTSMRRGELLRLRWQDVDFDEGRITIEATHTKTQRRRYAPLTPRSAVELLKIRKLSTNERVFPFVDVKRSFNGAKHDAGLDDVRFHDLRHTAITRLVRGGFSASEAGKIAGHTQAQTTYRYINTDADSLSRASQILETYRDTPQGNRAAKEDNLVSTMIN